MATGATASAFLHALETDVKLAIIVGILGCCLLLYMAGTIKQLKHIAAEVPRITQMGSDGKVQGGSEEQVARLGKHAAEAAAKLESKASDAQKARAQQQVCAHS
jgi:hypothetical protein